MIVAHVQLAKRPLRRQRWYFTLVSEGNGEVLATSELYTNRQDAIDTAHLIVPNVEVE